MAADENTFTERPTAIELISNGVVAAVLGAVGIYGLAEGEPAALVFVLPALHQLSNFRRRIMVTDDRLIVQGRWGRREVELRQITQVAMSPMVRPWVASTATRPFYLRMISRGVTSREAFVTELRRRATDAGAHLESAPEGRSSPKDPDPWFGA